MVRDEKITASIVLYKTPESMARSAIQSVLVDEEVHTLYLIDNSPTDTLATLAAQDRRIVYEHAGSNKGYGAGHNKALRHGIALRAKYHLILNPDVVLSNGALRVLRTYMDAHLRTALVMPTIFSPEGTRQYLARLLPTPWQLIVRRFVPQAFAQAIQCVFGTSLCGTYELKKEGVGGVTHAPSLSGCCMFLRVEALHKVGLFDERFFLYLEDFDLSRRIHEHYDTVCIALAHATHQHAAGSYKISKLLVHHIVSAIRYFNKWGWVHDQKRTVMNRNALQRLAIKESE